jgi:hypothetical protein
MKIRIVMLLATLGLSACATTVSMVPIGGSRSDGTVTMAYEYGMFQKPVVDVDGGARTAAERCSAWGYTSAEPFGGTVSTCVAANGYGNCLRWRVTATYQCTTPSAPK